MFLDLLGRTPNVTELNRFVGDTAPDKKAQLVNRLLGDDIAAYKRAYELKSDEDPAAWQKLRDVA